MNVLRGILVVALVMTISACGVAGMLTGWRMVDEVNKTRSPDDRLLAIGFPWQRRGDPLTEYRRLFPGGPLLRRQRLLAAVMFAAGVLLTALLQFPWFGILWMFVVSVVIWCLAFGPDIRPSRTR